MNDQKLREAIPANVEIVSITHSGNRTVITTKPQSGDICPDLTTPAATSTHTALLERACEALTDAADNYVMLCR